MNALLKFDSYEALLALHRGLMEAKFHREPNDPDIAGSPFLSRISSEVVDMLVAWDSERGRSDRWTIWREAHPQRREWHIAVGFAAKSNAWATWSIDEKRTFARILLSPLHANDEVLDKFILQADTSPRDDAP